MIYSDLKGKSEGQNHHQKNPVKVFSWIGVLGVTVRQIFLHSLVLHCQTYLHSALEEGLTSRHNISGWEKNVLWFIGISGLLAFKILITIVLGGAKCRTQWRCLCKKASGRNLFWWNVYVQKLF